MADLEEPTGFIDTKARITIGQIALIASIVGGSLVFYFNGQSGMGERINHVESDLGQRIVAGDGQLSDRIGKLEIRAAVVEQHQIQEDAAIADTRTAFNSFASDVRQQLSQLITSTAELRSLIVQSRDGNGVAGGPGSGGGRDGARH